MVVCFCVRPSAQELLKTVTQETETQNMFHVSGIFFLSEFIQQRLQRKRRL